MTSKTPELLPCPFCGSNNVGVTNTIGGGYVECFVCYTFGPQPNYPETAVDAWNTRTPTNHDDYDEAAKEVGLL